jgi:hypothetical protein
MNDGSSRLVEAWLHVSAGVPIQTPLPSFPTLAERRAARP